MERHVRSGVLLHARRGRSCSGAASASALRHERGLRTLLLGLHAAERSGNTSVGLWRRQETGIESGE